MQNLSKTLIATGIALTLSGGVAAAALMPTATASITRAVGGDAGSGVDRGPRGGDLMTAAATYIGITPDALHTELQAGASLADVALAHGKTRDGLIAALTTAATAELATLVDHKGAPMGPGDHGQKGDRGPGDGGAPLAAAATYLGISATDLQTKLAAGQTPAAVAAATAGKSRDGLIAAIVADGTAKLDAAKAAGTITAERATAELAELTDHATRFTDNIRGGPRHP